MCEIVCVCVRVYIYIYRLVEYIGSPLKGKDCVL